jgi:hypothetical protein
MFLKLVKTIDKKFLGKRFELVYAATRKRLSNHASIKALRELASQTPFRMDALYSKDYSNPLSILCDVHGSDKGEIEPSGHPYGWQSHSYADYYDRLFSHCRTSVTKVFECGVGTNNPDAPSSMGSNGKPGASLRVWRDYFPDAKVYGADIDKTVLFEEDRIKTFYVDQLSQDSIQNMWRSVGVHDFDLMVDDGLHTFKAGSTLFLNSISNLSSHGIYVIEDVHLNDLLKYREFFDGLEYAVEYVCLYQPSQVSLNNNLVVIRRFSKHMQ